MSFTDAIRDGFTHYATFSGRSSRSAYWWFSLFNALVVVAALVVDAALRTGGVFYVLTVLGIVVPNIALTVRRLHDTGHSGWWLLVSLVPLVGPIVLLVITLRGSEGPNQWATARTAAARHRRPSPRRSPRRRARCRRRRARSRRRPDPPAGPAGGALARPRRGVAWALTSRPRRPPLLVHITCVIEHWKAREGYRTRAYGAEPATAANEGNISRAIGSRCSSRRRDCSFPRDIGRTAVSTAAGRLPRRRAFARHGGARH